MIALIDDSHITAAPYFETTSAEDKTPEQDNAEPTRQENKPKSRIAAEILANGYLLQDHVVAKGLEYDQKYNLSSRLQNYLTQLQANGNDCYRYMKHLFHWRLNVSLLVKTFDEKYRIWDKAKEYNEKYKIQEKVNSAAQTAQNKAQAALQTPTGQKIHEFANQTLAQIAAVHYEAKKIQVRLSRSNEYLISVMLTASIVGWEVASTARR